MGEPNWTKVMESPNEDPSEVWGIYCYVNKNGDVIYIGIDRHINWGERHQDHLKPSKSKEGQPRTQRINEYLVSNKDWKYVVLVPIILNKDIAQGIETELINKYKPEYNVKRRA